MEPSLCGKQISVTNIGSNDQVNGTGISLVVTVADTCPGCPTAESIDFSVGAWQYLTKNSSYGTFEIEW